MSGGAYEGQPEVDLRTPLPQPLAGVRILQLVHSFDHGGVEALASMIGAGLVGHGARLTTHFLYPQSAIGRTRKLAALADAARRLVAERPDVVVAYQSTASVLAGFVGRLAGIGKRIVHQTAMPEGVDPLVRYLDRWAGSLGFYSANVVNSEACAAVFAAHPLSYRAALKLIPHGVAPLEVTRPPDEVRAGLNIAAGVPLLLCAGRLSQQKAQERIIAALPALASAHLVLAGSGPRQRDLAALANDLAVASRVTFLGAVAREDIGNLLSAADVFVFPSRWETFGLAPVEAAIAGVPVVANDLAVLREVLAAAGEPSPVRFVDAANARVLAEAIGAVMASATARAAARQFAPRLAARHDPARMIAAYVGLVASGARP